MLYTLQLVALVLAPLVFVVSLAAFSARSRHAFIVKVLAAGCYLALILMAGRWDIVGTWFRMVWPVFFAAAIVIGFLNCRGAELLPPLKPGRMLWLGTNALILVFFAVLLWDTRGAARFDGSPIALHSPLEATRWYRRPGRRYQRYTVDFTGLNSRGFRADSLYPADPGGLCRFRRSGNGSLRGNRYRRRERALGPAAAAHRPSISPETTF